jgi:hypothetical protein
MNFQVLRSIYTSKSTIGNFIVNNKIFCHTLEDVVRPKGSLKIPGQTAIPSGRYEVILSFSNRFQKILPEILNVPNFTGIRLHGGNTNVDTDGCLLVAYNIINNDMIQGSASSAIVELLQNYSSEKNYIEVLDSYPYTGIV